MTIQTIPFESLLPHKLSEVACLGCYHRWIAVRPEHTLLKQLECPGCGVAGLCVETGEVMNMEDDDAAY